MAYDQNSTETIPRLLNIPLKDWAIIFGIIGGLFMYYINTAGENAKRDAQMETMMLNSAETKSLLKEIQVEQRTYNKESDTRMRSMELRISILETQTGNGNKKQ